jgi:hypothetical protein
MRRAAWAFSMQPFGNALIAFCLASNALLITTRFYPFALAGISLANA